MASARDIDFVMSLSVDKFVEASRRAQKEADRSVGGIVNGFARVGLALDGVSRVYNLVVGKTQELVAIANVQEQAEAKVAAALKTTNQLTEENLKLLKDQASAIQSVTTSGDEQNLMLQALAINMGIAFEQIDEVTRGSIGLAESFAEAGLSQETALKGIALAYQGNFTQLQRYIPALRDATTESEKMAVLQTAMESGFEQATAAAGTQAGQMKQLENLVGDLKEQLGEVVKDGLVPLVKIAKPVLESLTGMDAGTRNASIALVGFLGIATKGPAVITAFKIALQSLRKSLGPVELLFIAVGAVSTVLGIYAASADEAREAGDLLSDSNINLADSYESVRSKALAAARALNIEQLTAKQAELNQKLKEQQALIDEINKPRTGKNISFAITEDDVEAAQKRLNDIKANIEAVEEAIATADEKRIEKKKELSQKELEELDKRRAFEFESNRISLQDYIEYLQSRRASLAESLGEDSIVYLQFLDKIRDLREKSIVDDSFIIDPSVIDSGLQLYEAFLVDMADLDRKYIEAKAAGAKAARAELIRQEIAGAKATASLGDEIVEAAQGNNKTVFNAGKNLSIANTTISAYEAIARAFKDYPFPFNLGIASIQGGLAFAQIAKIRATEFQPAGKALGGPVTREDILRSALTPPGEDGIIGVQEEEFVINKRAARNNLPLLRRINSGARVNQFGAFADGGQVGGRPASASSAGGAFFFDYDRLADILDARPIVFRSETDAVKWLRDNFPKYEKITTRNKIV